MDTTDRIQSELRQTNWELDRLEAAMLTERSRPCAGVSEEIWATRAKRDALRQELGAALSVQISSLDVKRTRLEAAVRSEPGGSARTRMRTELRDIDTAFVRLRQEFQTHVDAALYEADEEIKLAEVEACVAAAATRRRAAVALAELRVKRDELRQTVESLRTASGSDWSQARADFTRSMQELARHRSEGPTGSD
jgi:hypothetical protein